MPDSFGFGVEVDPGSTATVTCNSFSGWKTDLDGVQPQPLCVTTTTVPNGVVGTPYSTDLARSEGHRPQLVAGVGITPARPGLVFGPGPSAAPPPDDGQLHVHA